jgi:hypothetical protein
MRNNLLHCLQQLAADHHIPLPALELLPSAQETATEDEFMAAILK